MINKVPKTELDRFVKTIDYTRSLSHTATVIQNMTTKALDVSDMYRAALAQAVSAFDLFMHEEIRVRMVQLHLKGSVPQLPPAFQKFEISSLGLHLMRTPSPGFDSAIWFEQEVRRRHSHLSFQNAEKIADACRLVSNVALWQEVATVLNIQPQGSGPARINPDRVLRNEWNLIIDRRNLIVHEADYDPTPPRTKRYSIDSSLAGDAIDKVEDVGKAIASVLAR